MKVLSSVLLLTLVGIPAQATNYCDRKLCRGKGRHIACNGLTQLAPSCGSSAREIPLDSHKQAMIVALHNTFRSRVASGRIASSRNGRLPPAARMATMQWDDELASVAAANARRCKFEYDQCRSTDRFPLAGQNIALIGNFGRARTDADLVMLVISDWFAEYEDVEMGQLESYNVQKGGPRVGHFTQIAADRATHVGCSLVSFQPAMTTQWLFVCNYAITNIREEPVYVAGSACSGCMTGCNEKYPGLCNVEEGIEPKFWD
uniref:Venom allergen-1 n=1 Tax=Culex tarsalis TaxID=7177 RepID=A0A1Q3FTZ0_CULTA